MNPSPSSREGAGKETQISDLSVFQSFSHTYPTIHVFPFDTSLLCSTLAVSSLPRQPSQALE